MVSRDYSSELTAAEREWFEERSAIMEFDGGLSRAEAERAALALVLERRAEAA